MKQLKEIFDRLADVQIANNVAREELDKKIDNNPQKNLLKKTKGYTFFFFLISLSYIAFPSISSDSIYNSG